MKRNTKTKNRKATKPAKSKKPSLQVAIRRIRAKNAAFKKMTPAQKRARVEELQRSLTSCRALKAIDCGQADRYAEEAAELRNRAEKAESDLKATEAARLEVVRKLHTAESDLIEARKAVALCRNMTEVRDGACRQRDAAVAELARVREALNVLLREGGKGGAV